MVQRKKNIGPCEYCKDSEEYEYHYWHGDIEEDYDMGIYTCLCYRCFGQLNKEGKIKWKKKRYVQSHSKKQIQREEDRSKRSSKSDV